MTVIFPHPPPGVLTAPVQPALTVAPELWRDVASGIWTFGQSAYSTAVAGIQDIVRQEYKVRVAGTAELRTGKAGPGFSAPLATSGNEVIYGQYLTTDFNDTTTLLRPSNAEIAANGGWTFETLIQPFPTLTLGQAGIWTNDRDESRYSGLNIELTGGGFAQILIGDNQGSSANDRQNGTSSPAALNLGQLNHVMVSIDVATSDTNWLFCINGTTAYTSGSGNGGGVGYGTQTESSNRISACVANRNFVTGGVEGIVYGWNIFNRQMTAAEMQERSRRFWEMFTLATTRELQPTGFLNLRNTGPAPQAQSLS